MRTLDSNISTQFSSDSVVPYYAISAAFNASDILRIWSGYGDVTILGNTYSGAGELLNITQVSETSQTTAEGVEITISGIPSAILTYALDAEYQNKSIILYLGVLSKTTLQPVGNPYTLFSGLMDIMTISDSANTLSITVFAENRMIILNRDRIIRYTNEDQKRIFSDDKGLEYVASIQDKPFTWGSGGGIGAYRSGSTFTAEDIRRRREDD